MPIILVVAVVDSLNYCYLLQIRFFLLQNRVGKTRLSKWYVAAADDKEKARIESEIHRMVVARDRKYTSFIEVRLFL